MKENLNTSSDNGAEGKIQSQETFISEAECLRRVPVSRRTWFSWRMAGKIPTIKIGRRSIYHWPSVEAALLRMQCGGVMIITFLFVALAAAAAGQSTILGVHVSQAQAARGAVCNLPVGNTTAGQATNQSVSIVGPGNVSAEMSGLPGVVAAIKLAELDCASN